MLFVDAAHCVRRGNLARRTGRLFDFRQPEVENFGVPAFGDKNVGRLDVAMNNPLGVRAV
jgi:hypothetical protein